MARITITADVPDEVSDPDHPTGLTNAGYMELQTALMAIGYDDIDSNRG